MIKKIGLLGAICLAGLFTFAVHAGVIVEGGSTGMDKVVTLAYQPGQNSYTINGSTVLRCPVSAGEMVEIVRALRLDDRMGVAAKGDDQVIVLVDVIASGFSFEGFSSPEEAAETVADTWNGAAYLDIKDMAWGDILDYYDTIG